MKDNHPLPLTARCKPNTDVTDANEEFTLTDASHSTLESSAGNTNVGAIITGSDGTLSFSIAAGNSAGIFKVRVQRQRHPCGQCWGCW